jgi:hypothetical protein
MLHQGRRFSEPFGRPLYGLMPNLLHEVVEVLDGGLPPACKVLTGPARWKPFGGPVPWGPTVCLFRE